jgi:hypothetical protein
LQFKYPISLGNASNNSLPLLIVDSAHPWHAKFSGSVQTPHVSGQDEMDPKATSFRLRSWLLCNNPFPYLTSSSYQYIMHTTNLPYVLLIAALSRLNNAHTILDRQCWHEYPLSIVVVSSSSNRRSELVSPIQELLQAKEEDYAPWSIAPVCTHVLESINDELCIYTSTSFGNGRGISIFTTPTVAKQFAALPAFQNPQALSSQNINTPTNTWRATSIADKGIGMLAKKPLDFKDRVTAYTPAFLAYLETELPTLERERWWRFAIEQLPAEIKNEFLSLAYVFGDERFRVQDIVKANTFQMEVGGVNHLAVFPETSRLNHACNPKYAHKGSNFSRMLQD